MISKQAVPLLSRHITTRREPRGVLLYHKETDELYLVSESAAKIINMLDGSRTVEDLESNLPPICREQPPAEGAPFRDFLKGLHKRGVIEFLE